MHLVRSNGFAVKIFVSAGGIFFPVQMSVLMLSQLCQRAEEIFGLYILISQYHTHQLAELLI